MPRSSSMIRMRFISWWSGAVSGWYCNRIAATGRRASQARRFSRQVLIESGSLLGERCDRRKRLRGARRRGRGPLPEICRRACKLDAHFFLALLFRADVNDAAFPLFLRVVVHEQDGLTALHRCAQSQRSTVGVDGKHRRDIVERAVVRCPAIDQHGYLRRQPLSPPGLHRALGPFARDDHTFSTIKTCAGPGKRSFCALQRICNLSLRPVAEKARAWPAGELP